MPGSPLRHAPSTILLKSPRASRSTPVGSWVTGSISAMEPPSATAFMKASVAPTEMLKLWISPSCRLQSMNSSMSGWWTLMTAMLAPSRLPPWVIIVETLER